jgi:alcohol dehydrogenase (cytochrome c)
MNRSTASMLAGMVIAASPTLAAEVTPGRLINADREPQNWLMNHRTYDGQRFSPLSRIDRVNVRNLKLAFAVPLGGQVGNGAIEATPLAENGFLYITDSSGVLYKVDVTSGDAGRIVWTMDPKQSVPVVNRGAALWGNFVISPANAPARIVAADKDTGKVAWETNMTDGQPQLGITAAPLVINDRIIVGASLGDLGLRDWVAGLDAATGKVLWRRYTVPAPGEPGSETWKGTNNAWQTGGGAVWVTGTYDPITKQTFWGTGNPVPMFDPTHRPGDNLYTNSVLSLSPESGDMNWYLQYTPGDMWDYDEVGTHILIDSTVADQQRKLITHSARNGFLYTMDRFNGQIIGAKPYVDNVNWTKGIDQKTGKPIDYDPSKDIQSYAGLGNLNANEPLKKVCPSIVGGNNFWPSSYSPRTRLLYVPALTGCGKVEIVHNKRTGPVFSGGTFTTDERFEGNLTAIDPITFDIKANRHLRIPTFSGALSTGGGLVFLALFDGTVAAYDDTTLEQLWKINVGSGFTAPPMTYEVNGKQYVAIASGGSAVMRTVVRGLPELREMRQATVLYVFSL